VEKLAELGGMGRGSGWMWLAWMRYLMVVTMEVNEGVQKQGYVRLKRNLGSESTKGDPRRERWEEGCTMVIRRRGAFVPE